MKRLSATLLALGLSAAVGTASAQNYGGYTNQQNAIYDWARVVRVDPVIEFGRKLVKRMASGRMRPEVIPGVRIDGMQRPVGGADEQL